jgi:hypothetical protein
MWWFPSAKRRTLKDSVGCFEQDDESEKKPKK